MPQVGDALYLTLKVAHLLGVVAFLGGLAMAAYWKVAADRSGDPGHAARVHRRIRKMDKHVIGPGALVTFAAGYAMVRAFGSRIAERPFALWGLILMFAALGVWYFGQRRLTDKLAAEAEALEAHRQPLSPAYGKLSVAWLACGATAIGLVVLVAVMMVFRLPGP